MADKKRHALDEEREQDYDRRLKMQREEEEARHREAEKNAKLRGTRLAMRAELDEQVHRRHAREDQTKQLSKDEILMNNVRFNLAPMYSALIRCFHL
jgi:hypothetical protein